MVSGSRPAANQLRRLAAVAGVSVSAACSAAEAPAMKCKRAEADWRTAQFQRIGALVELNLWGPLAATHAFWKRPAQCAMRTLADKQRRQQQQSRGDSGAGHLWAGNPPLLPLEQLLLLRQPQLRLCCTGR